MKFLKYSLVCVFLWVPQLAHAQSSSDSALENKIFGDDAVDPTLDTPTVDEPIPNPQPVTPKKSDRSQREAEKNILKLDEAVKGPKEIPYDHILVVQNRYVRKEGRHEVTPLMGGVQPGDSFRKQIQWGFSYAYHFGENLGVEALHVAFLTNFNSGLSDSIRERTTFETYRAEPVFSIGSAFLWTPLHSKAATDESVYHFEGYFILGGGFTKIENETAGMAMGGFGFRAFMSKRAILKTEVRDYIDFGTQTEHRLNILVGASILIGGGS